VPESESGWSRGHDHPSRDRDEGRDPTRTLTLTRIVTITPNPIEIVVEIGNEVVAAQTLRIIPMLGARERHS